MRLDDFWKQEAARLRLVLLTRNKEIEELLVQDMNYEDRVKLHQKFMEKE